VGIYATQIVLIGAGLITSITVARTLGPQGRGFYAVAMAMGATSVQLGKPWSACLHFAQFRPQPSFAVLRAHVRLGIKGLPFCRLGFLLLRIDLLMVK